MKVTLLAHTQLSWTARQNLQHTLLSMINDNEISEGQVVALAAIRQCYSHKTAMEVLETESEKYFGEKGKEGERLFKQIVSSGHTSTLEHISFTFAVENVSRALLAQLTRHRHISLSVQSQRYVKLSSDSRSEGFEYVAPTTVTEDKKYTEVCSISDVETEYTATQVFEMAMEWAQEHYDMLIKCGIPQEDARSVLPNAATTNLVMTLNLRTALDFYSKRKPGNGAQKEITQLAEAIKKEVVSVEEWTGKFFE